MISSNKLAQTINDDLDQNAYTTWHTPVKIMDAINSACSFLMAYQRWPWNLKLEQKDETNPVDAFSFDYDLFYPYWAILGEEKLERTNIPIV